MVMAGSGGGGTGGGAGALVEPVLLEPPQLPSKAADTNSNVRAEARRTAYNMGPAILLGADTGSCDGAATPCVLGCRADLSLIQAPQTYAAASLFGDGGGNLQRFFEIVTRPVRVRP